MPALPDVVRRSPARDEPVVVMVSRFPVTRWSAVPRFLLHSLQIHRALATAPGLVVGGLEARLGRREFWTYSVWDSRESLGAFVRAPLHRDAMTRFRDALGDPVFATVDEAAYVSRDTWAARRAVIEAP